MKLYDRGVYLTTDNPFVIEQLLKYGAVEIREQEREPPKKARPKKES